MSGMDVLEIAPQVRRLTVLREDLAASALDALVVTHAPNIRYLSGFAGSAGVLVVLPDSATLVVDFRYGSAARRLTASNPALADALRIRVAVQGLDETLLEELRPCRRIGIESQSMTVARFNALSSALAHGAPTPLNTADPCPTLV